MSIKAQIQQAPLARFLGAAMLACVLAGCGRPGESEPAAGEAPGAEAGFAQLEPLSETDSVVAEIGWTPIYLTQVRREAAAAGGDAQALQPGDPLFEEALDVLIEQRLLALEARRRSLHQDAEARRRLAIAEERLLGNILVETAVAEAVTDEAARIVYDEQMRLAPVVEEVRARHILVATRREAEEAARLVAEGADFAQLALQISRDPATRLEGGDLGYFTEAGILPAFGQIAFATSVGEVSAPFQSEFGWHVLRVEDRRDQPRPSFEDMRPSILRFLTMQGIEGLLQDIEREYPVRRLTGQAPQGLRTDREASDSGAAQPGGDG
ncbi:MAG: peptidylprolyl isomerase [Pseudomonadota bacterium]